MLTSAEINTLISVCILQTAAVISPGPDFAIVTKNSLLYSRKIGIFSVLGILAGVLFHLSYLILGIGYLFELINQSLIYIKVGGCLYLGYLGIMGLKSSEPLDAKMSKKDSRVHLTPRSAFMTGFLTNVLNPKAILFLFSLFTVVIEQGTPTRVLVLAGFFILLITFIWFLILALGFSGKIRKHFLKYSVWIDRVTGAFLLFIAAKIAWSCF